jgi:hypothetical protein
MSGVSTSFRLAMTDQHPITPPPELLDQWAEEYWGEGNDGIANGEKHIATQAARWGADMELEACCKWVENWLPNFSGGAAEELLRAARRPQPPSLKEQALDRCNDYIDPDGIIRRALEALPND